MTPASAFWQTLIAVMGLCWSLYRLSPGLAMPLPARLRRDGSSELGRDQGCSGFRLTFMLSRRLRSGRKVRIARELPQFLDLLVLACDAGMNLPDALKLAGEAAGPEVSREMRIAFDEIQGGRSLPESLKQMAERTGVRAIDAFARSVARAMRLGSPMSQVFKAQAYLVRQQHRQQVEAMIGALPMKMTLVAVLLLFPPMLIMVLVPHLLLLFKKW